LSCCFLLWDLSYCLPMKATNLAQSTIDWKWRATYTAIH